MRTRPPCWGTLSSRKSHQKCMETLGILFVCHSDFQFMRYNFFEYICMYSFAIKIFLFLCIGCKIKNLISKFTWNLLIFLFFSRIFILNLIMFYYVYQELFHKINTLKSKNMKFENIKLQIFFDYFFIIFISKISKNSRLLCTYQWIK